MASRVYAYGTGSCELAEIVSLYVYTVFIQSISTCDNLATPTDTRADCSIADHFHRHKHSQVHSPAILNELALPWDGRTCASFTGRLALYKA